MNREYLMAAHTFEGQNVIGWLMSEKLDGMRAFWDGGITRGRTDSPWSNDVGPATGLWSRYGKVIYAPSTWLDKLPSFPCDGELYLGHGKFQEVMSVCRRHIPDDRWNSVRFMCFDLPTYDQFFTTGKINNAHCKMMIDWNRCKEYSSSAPTVFATEFEQTAQRILQVKGVEPVRQTVIHHQEDIEDLLSKVLTEGGEGVVIRHPKAFWNPTRSKYVLKYKPYKDAEATIVGYRWGAGKYVNQMGSMIVQYGKVTFDLSGFTDDERRMVGGSGDPGSTSASESATFTRGEQVTFRYRELSLDGVPKEARFLRKFVP